MNWDWVGGQSEDSIESVLLPSFPMWSAFPTSDYYEGSAPRPAVAAG